MSDSDCEIIEEVLTSEKIHRETSRLAKSKHDSSIKNTDDTSKNDASGATRARFASTDRLQRPAWSQNVQRTEDEGTRDDGRQVLWDSEDSLPSVNNPFASFAFGESLAPATRSTSSNSKRKLNGLDSSLQQSKTSRTKGVSSETDQQSAKGHRESSKKKTRAKSKGCTKAEDIATMSAAEVRELRDRWFGMVDRNGSEADQRFQVFVAVVLSSRAQASVVAEGVERLKARDGGLTVDAMASIEQEELAFILRSVHWNKAKSKHIREAADAIQHRHCGVVPRTRAHLLALPGIGPALGEVLVAVFRSMDSDLKTEDTMKDTALRKPSGDLTCKVQSDLVADNRWDARDQGMRPELHDEAKRAQEEGTHSSCCVDDVAKGDTDCNDGRVPGKSTSAFFVTSAS